MKVVIDPTTVDQYPIMSLCKIVMSHTHPMLEDSFKIIRIPHIPRDNTEGRR